MEEQNNQTPSDLILNNKPEEENQTPKQEAKVISMQGRIEEQKRKAYNEIIKKILERKME